MSSFVNIDGRTIDLANADANKLKDYMMTLDRQELMKVAMKLFDLYNQMALNCYNIMTHNTNDSIIASPKAFSSRYNDVTKKKLVEALQKIGISVKPSASKEDLCRFADLLSNDAKKEFRAYCGL